MNSFYSAFLNIHRSGVLTALAWLVPQESAARESQSRRILCTPYNHAPCHFMQSHLRKVYACLAVTCHLRFWQNDRGLLRATAVTRGWNGYRNKSQHRKLTLEKKILPPLQQGFEPATLQSRVRRSNHWAIPVHMMIHALTNYAGHQRFLWCPVSKPFYTCSESQSFRHRCIHLSICNFKRVVAHCSSAFDWLAEKSFCAKH